MSDDFTLYWAGANDPKRKKLYDWVMEYVDPATGKKAKARVFPRDWPRTPQARSRKKALDAARAKYAEKVQAKPTSSNPTLAALLDAALTETGRTRRKRPDTKTREHVFGLFLEYAAGCRVDRGGKAATFGEHGLANEVTPTMVDDFLTHVRTNRTFRGRKVGESTIARYAAALKRAYTFGADRFPGLASFRNPVRYREKLRSIDEVRHDLESKSYTTDEVQQMLQACREGYDLTVYVDNPKTGKQDEQTLRQMPPPYLGDLITVLYYVGLRPGDAFNLKWEHVDIERWRILATSKTSAKYVAVLFPEARDVLRRRHAEQRSEYVFYTEHHGKSYPLESAKAGRHLRAMLKAIGIPNRRTFYGLRHGFARGPGQALRPHELQRQMRHENISTTSIYLESDLSYADRFLEDEPPQ